MEHRFAKIFLTSVDDNIYVLIVLFTNISMKLSRFLVNLLSIAFSSFSEHFPALKFSFFIFQEGPQWKYSFLVCFFLCYPSYHNI